MNSPGMRSEKIPVSDNAVWCSVPVMEPIFVIELLAKCAVIATRACEIPPHPPFSKGGPESSAAFGAGH